MFTCQKCDSKNIRFMTSMIFSVPIKYYHDLIQEAYTDPEFIVYGVMWDSDVMLSCADCGRVLLDRHTLFDQIDNMQEVIKWMKKGYVSYPRHTGAGEVCSCKICKKEWYIGEDEEHTEECLIQRYVIKEQSDV